MMTEIRLAFDFAAVAGTSFSKFERIYHTNYIWLKMVLWNIVEHTCVFVDVPMSMPEFVPVSFPFYPYHTEIE